MFNFNGKTYVESQTPGLPLPTDQVAIDQMSGADLVSTFNLVSANLGKGRVKRFADTAAGRRRLLGILTEYEQANSQDEQETAPPPPPAKPGSEPAPPPASDPPKQRAERKKRGMRFVFPAEKEIKPVREGTARAKALAILLRDGGGTFADVQAATGWNEKQAYEGIRLLHYYSGYGLKEKVVDGATMITAHK